MVDSLEQLRRSAPALARLDPLSTEVRAWLDRAYDAVKRVDAAEGVIFAMHERYLLDPAGKIVAAEEIVATVQRAARTVALMRKMGVAQRPAA